MLKKVRYFFLTAFVTVAYPAYAQNAPSVEEVLEAEETAAPTRLPTTLVTRWTRDQKDNETYVVLVNQPFSKTVSGSFRAGHVDLNEPGDRFRFELGGVGATWQPSRFAFSFSFDIWGDIDVIRNRDFNGAVLYQGDKWDWDVRLQHRIIDFKLDLTLPDGTTISGGDQTYSDTWGATVYYKPTPNWSFYAGGNDYDYETNLETINLAFELGLLTLDSVMLAAQYSMWNVSFGADYRFGPRQLGIRYTVDQPIFGPLKARTYAFNFAFPITKRFRFDGQLGLRDTIDGPADNNFYGIASLITRF